jgi:predicted PurR-regulated permease PerM
MKINWNTKYFTIAVYAVLATIVSAIAILIIFNFDEFLDKMSVIGAVLTPIVIGIFCAYLLNPLMMKFEKGVFRKLSSSDSAKKRGAARGISLTLTMVTVLAFFALIIIMVIPQLITNIISIFDNMDSYIDTLKSAIANISDRYPTLAEFLGNPLDDFSKFVSNMWSRYSGELLGFAGNVATGIWAVLDTLKNVIIGLIISIYLLARKEMFIGQSKKLIFAFVRVERAQKFLAVCREASKKFLGSIIGKIVEAMIVAVFCFLGCVIMGMPYSLLIAAIMFVFNLIPFIGPAIGCVPCALLLLLSDEPIKALWFIIFMVILQNVDGNIIAPWILGDSTGLPAVWILISILVGGGLFGILGIFLGVPVCAVIYMLFKNYIEERLKRRKLPQNTTEYVGNVEYITPDFEYVESERAPVPESAAPEKDGQKPRIRLKDKVRAVRTAVREKYMGDGKNKR